MLNHVLTPQDRDESKLKRLLSHLLGGAFLGASAGAGLGYIGAPSVIRNTLTSITAPKASGTAAGTAAQSHGESFAQAGDALADKVDKGVKSVGKAWDGYNNLVETGIEKLRGADDNGVVSSPPPKTPDPAPKASSPKNGERPKLSHKERMDIVRAARDAAHKAEAVDRKAEEEAGRRIINNSLWSAGLAPAGYGLGYVGTGMLADRIEHGGEMQPIVTADGKDLNPAFNESRYQEVRRNPRLPTPDAKQQARNLKLQIDTMPKTDPFIKLTAPAYGKEALLALGYDTGILPKSDSIPPDLLAKNALKLVPKLEYYGNGKWNPLSYIPTWSSAKNRLTYTHHLNKNIKAVSKAQKNAKDVRDTAVRLSGGNTTPRTGRLSPLRNRVVRHGAGAGTAAVLALAPWILNGAPSTEVGNGMSDVN